MKTKTLEPGDLAGFIGTENWYRHGLIRDIFYSDGAKYVADHGGAYWLLDEIAIPQKFIAALKREDFQVWKLSVKDTIGVLTCENGNGKVLLTKDIPYTDFPLDEIRFYLRDGVIMLPSEY